MKNKDVYIVFGDMQRSDGKNIEAIYFSKEKAEKYKSALEDMSVGGSYHIEHFTVEVCKNYNTTCPKCGRKLNS